MNTIADALFNSNPAMLHAAMVHGPVVLSMLAFFGLVLSAILTRNKTLRWVTFGLHFLLLVAVSVAVATGENTVAQVPSEYSAEVWEHIEAHEELAETTRMVVAVVFVLTAVAFASGLHRGRHLIWLALLGSAIVLGMVFVVAHRGGNLVYSLGVGTPPPPAMQSVPAPVQAVPAPVEADPAEPEIEEADPVEPEPAREVEPPASTPPEAEAPNFANDIHPIMVQHCIDCHEAEDPSSALDLTSLEGTMKGGTKAGPSVVPGDPDASPLVQYLEGTRQPQMPKRAPALDAATIQTVRDWIAAGAK